MSSEIAKAWDEFCTDDFDDSAFDYHADRYGLDPWFLNSKGQRKAWFYFTEGMSMIWVLVKKDLPGFSEVLDWFARNQEPRPLNQHLVQDNGYIQVSIQHAMRIRGVLWWGLASHFSAQTSDGSWVHVNTKTGAPANREYSRAIEREYAIRRAAGPRFGSYLRDADSPEYLESLKRQEVVRGSYGPGRW